MQAREEVGGEPQRRTGVKGYVALISPVVGKPVGTGGRWHCELGRCRYHTVNNDHTGQAVLADMCMCITYGVDK